MFLRIAAGVGAVLVSGPLLAQGIVIQQPIVSQFSVGTTVMVPDRGGVLLGAVKRAGDVGRQFGPLGLAGRSRGSFRDYSGVSAHVWIHDFEAMDHFLLSQPPGYAAAPGDFFFGGGARPVTSELWELRQSSPITRSPLEMPPRRVPPSTVPSPTPASNIPPAPAPAEDEVDDRGETHYHMGLKALGRGATEIAKIHFRIARRHGSDEAARLLASLGGNVTED